MEFVLKNISVFICISFVLKPGLHMKFRDAIDISPLTPSNKPNVKKLKKTEVPGFASFYPPQILPTIFQNLASLES